MALNMGMLATNDQAKEMLDGAGVKGAANTLGASAIAGFFASFMSLPFDYVKTQLQKMQPLPDGKMPYSGALDCAAKTLANGGPLKFYTGFPTFYVRIAPHAMSAHTPLGPAAPPSPPRAVCPFADQRDPPDRVSAPPLATSRKTLFQALLPHTTPWRLRWSCCRWGRDVR
jgi:hypothetical protein